MSCNKFTDFSKVVKNSMGYRNWSNLLWYQKIRSLTMLEIEKKGGDNLVKIRGYRKWPCKHLSLKAKKGVQWETKT